MAEPLEGRQRPAVVENRPRSSIDGRGFLFARVPTRKGESIESRACDLLAADVAARAQSRLSLLDRFFPNAPVDSSLAGFLVRTKDGRDTPRYYEGRKRVLLC